MTRNVRTTFLFSLALVVFLVSIYHHLFRDSVSDVVFRPSPGPLRPQSYNQREINANQALHETTSSLSTVTHHSINTDTLSSISTVSILFPAWEVLTVVSPEIPLPLDSVGDQYVCIYHNVTSVAKPAGILPFPDRRTFKCDLPRRVRRRLPFPKPVLAKSPGNTAALFSPAEELLRWNFLVYDSLSTEDDVVLFVKGVNKRQGLNRQPSEFMCVFGDDLSNGVRTAVKTSLQEVFRCQRPNLTAVPVSPSSSDRENRIKASLEIMADKVIVPSVAYFTPARTLAPNNQKSLLCACTMVYNVAKFLKEWVLYHSRIGVDKFILYDNGSDDELHKIVEELIQQGYDVKTLFWLWPKTQEAGFSHCAIYSKNSCSWMMYIDVDEFVYSPSWYNSSHPSKSLLHSFLYNSSSTDFQPPVGQFIIGCREFGPSNQSSHPVTGVTQGYNCRKQLENRHKSIVLLDAIDESLLNVIHHFNLKVGYRVKKFGIEEMVVNHYKYQAWEEFKAKFRRRVSAYVVDWTQAVNPNSNDRTPGLGFAPVEPEGWPEKFCEVYDDGLKELTVRWFGVESASGFRMAWQR